MSARQARIFPVVYKDGYQVAILDFCPNCRIHGLHQIHQCTSPSRNVDARTHLHGVLIIQSHITGAITQWNPETMTQIETNHPFTITERPLLE